MPGQAPGQVVPLTATKTWSQFRVLLSPSATNLVGVPHTFTATVQTSRCGEPDRGGLDPGAGRDDVDRVDHRAGHARSGVDVSDRPGDNRWDVPVHRARRRGREP